MHTLMENDVGLQKARISGVLQGIDSGMSGLTSNPLIRNALFDSESNERYLTPFLQSLQSISDMPIDILFTDFEGREIVRNGNKSFSEQEVNWLREKFPSGQDASRIQLGEKGEDELLAVNFIIISESVEGALLYRIKLGDLPLVGSAKIVHGKESKLLQSPVLGVTAVVYTPPIYKHLNFTIFLSHDSMDMETDWGSLRVFFILGVGVVVAVIILGLYFGRRLTRDLLSLEFFARRITEKGFSGGAAEEVASLEVASLEVASLAQSINHMMESLEQEHTKLTEEVDKNKALVGHLVELDKVKSDLIQNVNHELRTPLTSIIGYMDIIIDSVDSSVEPKLAASLAIVQHNALRLQLFTENMMQASKIEFEQVPLVISTVDIGELLGDIGKALKWTADDSGVEVMLRLDSPASDLLIDGEHNQLEQVFVNLVHNAIKFTPSGGKVTIVARHAHVDDGYVEVKVTDTGIGIPVKEFPNMFKRLFRASTALDADIPGFGIGLSLVYFIVQQHHGTITFDSTVGKGTVFTVTLPARYVGTSSPVETT